MINGEIICNDGKLFKYLNQQENITSIKNVSLDIIIKSFTKSDISFSLLNSNFIFSYSQNLDGIRKHILAELQH